MNLRGNSLNLLPPEVGSFSALCTLDLSCNKLKVLPEMIGQVTSLKELDLSDNPDLSRLPRSFIGLVKVIGYILLCVLLFLMLTRPMFSCSVARSEGRALSADSPSGYHFYSSSSGGDHSSESHYLIGLSNETKSIKNL